MRRVAFHFEWSYVVVFKSPEAGMLISSLRDEDFHCLERSYGVRLASGITRVFRVRGSRAWAWDFLI